MGRYGYTVINILHATPQTHTQLLHLVKVNKPRYQNNKMDCTVKKYAHSLQHHFLLLWFDLTTGCLLSSKYAYDLRAASLLLRLSFCSE